ncbi:MAG: TIGR02099 family protein [Polaromonas sp.]|uniref:YhdP family protein n=1 Tax=Polaromonas sp. TaxID=1869339 RepID=UPI0025E1F4E2|nr:YhdP family protein [Polaromonas sp.]MBI2725747.1 TIGR02099 family protein [Polaromonas sp.]
MTETKAASPTPAPHPALRRMRWLAMSARVLVWFILAVWLLFTASWGLLHGWIVPRIGEFRPRLEMEATKALGVPVRIGQITARSEGLIPSFELRDVVLLDPQGREALRLPRLLAALSPTSLWGKGFEQLHIDQPELDIRRTADGKIYVGGLDVSQNRADNHEAVDWIFSQRELSIKGGTIRWTDELRRAPTLALGQVDGVLRNSRRGHNMRVDATPPPQWGERFSVRGLFRQPLLSRNPGDWSEWSGQLFAEFGRIDVSRVKEYVSLEAVGMDLKTGNGSLRAWADIERGQITGGTFDVALADVDVRLGKTLQPLAIESVNGRFGGRQIADGFDFNTEGLRFNTRDGLKWPGGNLAVVYTDAQGKTGQRGELKADRLDLATVAQIAARLPLGTATHSLLSSYAPKGLVEAIDARWQVPREGPLSYAARGRVTGLELSAVPSALPSTASHPHAGRPGVSGAAVDFDVTQDGGKAAVSIARGFIDVPGIFEDPRITLNSLSMDAQWKTAGAKIETQLRNIKFSGDDAEGVAQLGWQSGEAGSLGVIDLQGSLARGNGARVHRYLPLVLPDRVRHYVRDAVVHGDVSDVKFRVRGPVDEIPFSNPARGEFKVTAKVKNGTFVYVPASAQGRDAQTWPGLGDVQGELVFNRASLEVNNATARVAAFNGLQLVRADARIPDLMRAATVELNASIKGPLTDALGFVNASPLAMMTDQVLAKAVGSGAASYGLRLNIPLNEVEKTKVQGTVSLPGNDVQFTPASPMLSRLRGVVAFSEKGFNVPVAQARLLGGDVRFDGAARAAGAGEASVVFRAQGNLTAEGLRQAKDMGLVSRLAQHATGGAAYTATIGFRRGVPEVMVTSNLQGLAVNLPAPFAKPAETILPLRFENALLRESLLPGQKPQDQLSLSIGRLASIAYVRDVSGTETRVIRGSVGVGLEPGEAVQVPESGVAANINLARADIDAWEKVLAEPAALAAPSAGAAVAGRGFSSGAALAYLPNQLAIRARELVVDGRKLNDVVVGAFREGLNWRANVSAVELNGYVEFRQPGGQGAGRLYARLSRLSLGQGNATDVENLLEEQPASIPALDIVVEDLELRGKKLGRIEIEAVNRGASVIARDGGVREWRLNKFNVILPEAVLTATGNWVAVNAQAPGTGPVAQRAARVAAERRRTVMNFKLDISDSGELLKRFGMADVVRRGKGRMEGQVAWMGSPLSLDYPSMNGQFNVNIESGQFLKADPGIAKLLGVLSLQSLPRRLTLDFRDVFSEGFAFDFVRGDVNIAQGVAATNNLQMKGVNAAVLMEGSADIAKETQDIKVVVVPEINAGTASLIATVINPAIGLGSFLAQYFLRRPLIQATTQEFHIDGSWADPKITKVERKP